MHNDISAKFTDRFKFFKKSFGNMKTLICQRVDLTILKPERSYYKPNFPLYFLFNGDYTLHEAEMKLWENRDKTLQALKNHFKYHVRRNVRRDIVEKFYTDYGLIFTKSGVWPIGKDYVIIEVD